MTETQNTLEKLKGLSEKYGNLILIEVYGKLEELTTQNAAIVKERDDLLKEKDEKAWGDMGWLTKCHDMEQERNRLRDAIQKTIDENRYLADGDNCTLRYLVSALGRKGE